MTLLGHEVRSAYEMRWAELTNGKLLDAAEQAGFDILITGDKRLRHQQRIKGRAIAVVILGPTHWWTIRANPQPICDAVSAALAGTYDRGPFAHSTRRHYPLPQP